MATNTQVKKLIEDIGLDKSENPDFDNKLNTSIQNKFDSVFKDSESAAEGEEAELSFSANAEKTNNNIKIVESSDDSDFKLDDDAPLSLGNNSSPALSMPEATDSNISFSNGGTGSLKLAAIDESTPEAESEAEDISFGEILEEEAVKEVSAPAMPLPTKTRLQAVPREASSPEIKMPSHEEDVVVEEVDEGSTDFAASEDETGEIETPDFSAEVAPAVTIPSEKVLYNFDQNEVARLQSMVRELRLDREDLLKQIHQSQKELKVQTQSNLTLKVEVEDTKIELNVMKKRHSEEIVDLKHHVQVSEHKKQEYAEKVKNYQREFERLGQKVQFEVAHVKKREKELETKLELLIMDSQSQIQGRDTKTLELKRKIDALEFNMENLTIQEAKAREDKIILEDKLNKIMKNLRGSIKVIESDISHELSGMTKNDSDKSNS